MRCRAGGRLASCCAMLVMPVWPPEAAQTAEACPCPCGGSLAAPDCRDVSKIAKPVDKFGQVIFGNEHKRVVVIRNAAALANDLALRIPIGRNRGLFAQH